MGILKRYPAIGIGFVITVLFAALFHFGNGFLDSIEYKFYDARMSCRDSRASAEDIVIIDIDDDSIDRLGRWPWPRVRIAECIDRMREAGARVVGLNMIFSEPQESSGLEVLDSLIRLAEIQGGKGSDTQILDAMKAQRKALDNDAKLAAAIRKSGNIFLPFYLKNTIAGSVGPREAEKDLKPLAIPVSGDVRLPAGNNITPPIAVFEDAARGMGHVNLAPDKDGILRRHYPVYGYRDIFLPSFSMILAARYLDIAPDTIRLEAGKGLLMGENIRIPLTPGGSMLVSFRQSDTAPFKRFPFHDVLSRKIPPEIFKDKIVIITLSAVGTVNPVATPVDSRMSLGEFTASILWTVLNRQFLASPDWDRMAGYIMIGVVFLLIALVLPRLRAFPAALFFLVVAGALVASSFWLFTEKGLWVRVTYPFLQLVCGYIGAATAGFFMAESDKEHVERGSAETNRLLGLSFQSQGMLDMAFDKFRQVPMDDQMKEVLFNLALDFERKRQYNKAATVYEYIEEYDPEYKNIGERKKKLVQASETMVFGDTMLGGGSGSDDLLKTVSGTRPTLGRYEIIKPLGKGAMGVVYMGKDPRINRTTAIKTFKFAQDFEPDEARRLKEKFFREAESAGNLSHPNIVNIYDAGEEQDLAYIAMEYLDGHDFSRYTRKKNMLPLRRVIDIMAELADALDYAHEKGIVHRDIKPANIMLLDSGVVKITDFGIARIAASSQTQTGVVKGTPHYMSPEQITGKKVDGRSDLFSLGTMCFQLVSGELPFKGDSPAALMHQILNVRHPDPRTYNKAVLKPLVGILDKMLEKDLKKRYQRGSHIAIHLRMLGKKMDEIRQRLKQNAGK
ncbi:MAG: serine/threonine protein kinase [Desulfobacterales bacterium]|nr:MAG: serine/threonine protein kinase [Desulfobacterales bacterium]